MSTGEECLACPASELVAVVLEFVGKHSSALRLKLLAPVDPAHLHPRFMVHSSGFGFQGLKFGAWGVEILRLGSGVWLRVRGQGFGFVWFDL